MMEQTLEERRRYVEQVKASFQNPEKSGRYRDVGAAAEAEENRETDVFSGSSGAWKWRLVVALLLFGGFMYLSQNQMKVGAYTVQEVADYLSKDMEWEGLLKELPVSLDKIE